MLPDSRSAKATLIEWDEDMVSGLATWLADAQTEIDLILSQVDIQPIHWLPFGADSLKSLGISPDAFCQAVLQVASLRYFGKHVLTYESASLRTFHQGRTECIRTASPAMTCFARTFVDAALSKGVTEDETKEIGCLLRNAGKVHSKLVKQASQMQGVDRHLLGLRLMGLTNGLSTPKIFQEEGWNTEFLLTTSQSPIVQEHLKVGKLAKECQSFGGGFGATSMDGVGCSYHILPDRLYFYPGVRSAKGAPADCAKMAALVREAIFGVHELLGQTAAPSK